MVSPFPGMDPYLEHPDLWSDVHHRLITTLADTLGPQVRPRYVVRVDFHAYREFATSTCPPTCLAPTADHCSENSWLDG